MASGIFGAAAIRGACHHAGNPAAAQALLRHTLGNAQRQAQQRQTVSASEEQAVRSCMPEIQAMLLRKRKPSRA